MTGCPAPSAHWKQVEGKQERYRRTRLAPFVQLRVWQCDSHLSSASSTWRSSKRLTPVIEQASYGAQWFRTRVNRHEFLSSDFRHAAGATNCGRPPIVDGSGHRGRRPDRLPRGIRAGGCIGGRLSGDRRRAVAARAGNTPAITAPIAGLAHRNLDCDPQHGSAAGYHRMRSGRAAFQRTSTGRSFLRAFADLPRRADFALRFGPQSIPGARSGPAGSISPVIRCTMDVAWGRIAGEGEIGKP